MNKIKSYVLTFLLTLSIIIIVIMAYFLAKNYKEYKIKNDEIYNLESKLNNSENTIKDLERNLDNLNAKIYVLENTINRENNTTNDEDDEIIKKGDELFGDDYCLGDHIEEAGQALGGWDCVLCGRNTWDVQMPDYVLCYSCEKVTGRCHKCGKLLRDNK